MEKPSNYRIKVQGELNEKWSLRLGGMSITVDHSGKQGLVTTLVGPLRDQSALSGVLCTLNDLHLAVLSVECLEK